MTPTVADGNATVTVNGASVTSGAASASIPLNVGSNAISIIVTAQDSSTRTCTVTVTRLSSDNADLSGLAVSAGALTPAFTPTTVSYTLGVANATTSTTVTPTVADAAATVTVNGNAATSGTASAPIALTVGVNSISILVSAQDSSVQAYHVAVTRAGSNESSLSSLGLDVPGLPPGFRSGTTSYTLNVGNFTSSIALTPTPDNPNAPTTINGVPVVNGATETLPLAVGANTPTILVTAEDGLTSTTYVLSVFRGPALTDPAVIPASGGWSLWLLLDLIMATVWRLQRPR